MFKPLFYNIFENNEAKTNGSTTFTKPMLLEPLVSATLFLDLSTVFVFSIFQKCYNTNGFSNIMFGNFVKPLVLATLIFGDSSKPMVLQTSFLEVW